MTALKRVGVPYSLNRSDFEANVERFGEETAMMLDINRAEDNLIAQAQQGNFDGDRSFISEMDAIVAYLQVLGTMVDFNQYSEGYFAEFR